MWEIMKWVMICIFLFLCSVQDIKEKRISVKMLILAWGLFLVLSLLFEQRGLEERMRGMLPGLAAFVTAFLTKEQIGYGDAVCLTVLGNVVSCDILLGALLCGLLILSVCSIVLLMKKKANRRTMLPFLPFLTAGMLWQMIVN